MMGILESIFIFTMRFCQIVITTIINSTNLVALLTEHHRMIIIVSLLINIKGKLGRKHNRKKRKRKKLKKKFGNYFAANARAFSESVLRQCLLLR